MMRSADYLSRLVSSSLLPLGALRYGINLISIYICINFIPIRHRTIKELAAISLHGKPKFQ